MTLSCLQIVQTACRRIGAGAIPAAVVTSTDPAIQQFQALLEEEGQEQAARYPWQTLQKEATFTTVATETQAAMATIAPGWDYIVNNTIWNRTLRRPVYGPKSEQDWQQVKAMQLNGPFNAYRVKGNSILFYPTPAAGQLCYFEYITTNWVNTSVGGLSSTVTNDADTIALDEQLTVLGLIWRWKMSKGLDFSADFEKYEKKFLDTSNRDASKPILNMDGAQYDIQPVILVPTGSWGV